MPRIALPLALVLAGLLFAPRSASADFRSGEPGQFYRNRCISRSMLAAGLVSAPIGLTLLTSDSTGGRVAAASSLSVTTGLIATGMAIRIMQPDRAQSGRDARARWLSQRCEYRAIASWGGPLMVLGAWTIAAGRLMPRNPFLGAVPLIATLGGVLIAGAGLAMTIYGTVRARRLGDRPPPSTATPLISVQTGALSLQLGLTSVGVGGSF